MTRGGSRRAAEGKTGEEMSKSIEEYEKELEKVRFSDREKEFFTGLGFRQSFCNVFWLNGLYGTMVIVKRPRSSCAFVYANTTPLKHPPVVNSPSAIEAYRLFMKKIEKAK